MKRFTLFALIICIISFSAQADDCTFSLGDDDSLKKATGEFHDIMAPLWHGPVQKGDVSSVRAGIEGLVAAKNSIMNASLPNDKKEKCVRFSQAALAFSASVDALSNKVNEDADDDQVKAAFASMHDHYEKMMRSLIDMSKYVERFHDVMSPLWHEAWEAKDVEAIRKGTPTLVKLSYAIRDSADNKKQETIETLVTAVKSLQNSCEGGSDQDILDAMEEVHEAYHALTNAFNIEEEDH